MYPKRSVFIAAALFILALLPLAAAVAVPTADSRLRSAFTGPLAAVSGSSQTSSSADTPSDLGAMTAVGACLLGLAAVVRRAGT